jgi:protein-L-isoaspartate(D-aspartate) O-methyltransferase
VRSRHADGRLGWPDEAPFDAIIATAAGAELDAALLEQLAPDGCLVAPVGPAGRQTLLRLRRIDGEWKRESLGAVSFVPLLGGIG